MALKRQKTIRVAILQFASQDCFAQKNYETFNTLLKKLKRRVDLIVLPEMWLSGFDLSWSTKLVQETDRVLKDLQRIAQTKKTYIVGSNLEKDGNAYYNTASLISPSGKILSKYRKTHLFKMGEEEKKFSHGNKIFITKTSIGNLGIAICYDIRFPELIRKMVLKGAEILIIPSAWPKKRIDHYLTLLKARAIENHCFVISANKVGKNSLGIRYGGNSVAFDPWGRVLGKLKESSGILEVELDLNELHRIRRSFPVLKDRREEVY